MTLTEIGAPQISGGCPYKDKNSQWAPTGHEAMRKTKMNMTTLQAEQNPNFLLII